MSESNYKKSECVVIEKVKDLNIQNCDYKKIKKVEFKPLFTCHDMGFKTTPNELKEKVIIDFIKNFKNVEEIIFPNDLYEIPDNAFKDFKKLHKITLPQNIKVIGECAFFNCDLYECDLGYTNSLYALGDDAFSNNKNLATLTILSNKLNLTSDGELITAFTDCPNLKSITVTKSNIETIMPKVFRSFPYVKTITLPYNIKHIGRMAFGGMINLETIYLPYLLNSIDAYAFYDCFQLKNFRFTDNLKFIGDNAFRSCYSLEKLVLPKSVAEIGDFAFESCTKLKVQLSKHTKVHKNTFSKCLKVKYIDKKEKVIEDQDCKEI